MLTRNRAYAIVIAACALPRLFALAARSEREGYERSSEEAEVSEHDVTSRVL